MVLQSYVKVAGRLVKVCEDHGSWPSLLRCLRFVSIFTLLTLALYLGHYLFACRTAGWSHDQTEASVNWMYSLRSAMCRVSRVTMIKFSGRQSLIFGNRHIASAPSTNNFMGSKQANLIVERWANFLNPEYALWGQGQRAELVWLARRTVCFLLRLLISYHANSFYFTPNPSPTFWVKGKICFRIIYVVWFWLRTRNSEPTPKVLYLRREKPTPCVQKTKNWPRKQKENFASFRKPTIMNERNKARSERWFFYWQSRKGYHIILSDISFHNQVVQTNASCSDANLRLHHKSTQEFPSSAAPQTMKSENDHYSQYSDNQDQFVGVQQQP